MLIVRFFLLMQVFHWANFFRMKPWTFLLGILLFPYHLFTRLLWHPSQHSEMVSQGVEYVRAYWEIPGGTLKMPTCIKQRLLALKAEADRG